MRRVISATVSLLLPAFAFAAGPTFTVVDLGTLPGLQWAPVQPLVPNSAPGAGGFYGSLGGGVTYIYQQTSTAAVGESSIANPTCNDVVFHAFFFQSNANGDSGTILDLGTLDGCQSTALAFNSSNVVVGWSQLIGGTSSAQAGGGLQTAFVWKNGTMQALPSLLQSITTENEADNNISSANGIDSSGEIVGWTIELLGTGQLARRATLWEDGAAAQPLELQYQLGSASGSIILTNASGINCQGNVAATGYPVNSSTSDIHSYLLVRQGAARSCPQ